MKMIWLNFKIKFKNRRDFIGYGCRLGYVRPVAIAINLTILIYTIVNLETLLCVDNLFLLIFLIFTNLIWQSVSLTQDYRSFTGKTSYYNLHSIAPGSNGGVADELKDIYEDVPIHFQGNKLLHSSRINRLLQGNVPIQARMGRTKEKTVSRYIRSHRDLLLPFLNQKWHDMQKNDRSFYNEVKLCMASEFTGKGASMQVELCKGCYYNSYLTNFIYTKRLSHQSGFPLDPPRSVANFPIRRLDKTIMSDHIGVSTLAVTTDGITIILAQNGKAMTSADLLTPSGTGSADLKDFKPGADFRESIKTAAERELCEETGISGKQIGQTVITGFYRDVERGGKPEFCCITFLNVEYSELPNLKPNAEEQRDDVRLFQILNEDNELAGPDFHAFSTLFSPLCPDEDRPSLALYMCFVMLCQFYKRPFDAQ